MNLFLKIYIWLIIGLSVLLVTDGYLNFQREVAQFDTDMAKNALFMGNIMAGIVRHTWIVDGEEKAGMIIDDANQNENQAQFRKVSLMPGNGNVPEIPLKDLDAVKKGENATFKITKDKNFRYTYVPVKTGKEIPGEWAIEIVQPLTSLNKYRYEMLLRAVITAGFSLLISGALFFLLFHRMIRMPLFRLSEKASRIREGDLTPNLEVAGKSEFADFASAMNNMCRHLSEAREAAEKEYNERIKAVEQLQHSERLTTIGRLSSGMAHELGTPLNVVSGRAKLIKSGELSQEEVMDSARIIIEQAARMTRIMQQVVNYARCKSHHKTPEDMEKLTESVLNMLQQTARKGKVEFALMIENDMPKIWVDQSQIQQVLINVIMNGIQAMTLGGTLTVKVGKAYTAHRVEDSGEKRKYLVIAIQDQGEGISDEHLAHIFEPFFTTKKVGEGSGLGLSIVSGIVEEHGGWIDVDSVFDQGTTFTIYLPMEEVK